MGCLLLTPTIISLFTLKAAKKMMVRCLTKARIAQILRAMPALVGGHDSRTSLQSPHDIDEFSWKDLVEDYYRVMEIAHYVRRGGVKAMLYRVETGRTTFVPSDYFDEAHQSLSSTFRNIYVPRQPADEPVHERLAHVTEEEENAVAEFLPEIDQILLSVKRKAGSLTEDL